MTKQTQQSLPFHLQQSFDQLMDAGTSISIKCEFIHDEKYFGDWVKTYLQEIECYPTSEKHILVKEQIEIQNLSKTSSLINTNKSYVENFLDEYRHDLELVSLRLKKPYYVH